MKKLPQVDGQRNPQIVLAIIGCAVLALFFALLLIAAGQGWALTGVAICVGAAIALHMISAPVSGEDGENRL